MSHRWRVHRAIQLSAEEDATDRWLEDDRRHVPLARRGPFSQVEVVLVPQTLTSNRARGNGSRSTMLLPNESPTHEPAPMAWAPASGCCAANTC
jgi:hypothetical protein